MTSNRQNIIITGASSGLGYTMAKLYAAQGKTLGLCARREENLAKLKSEINQMSPQANVIICPLDVDNHRAVFDAFDALHKDMGRIDRVIVNAGVGKGASLGTGFFNANKATAITNFVSALAQCEAAVEIFREQNAGHLVTISSVSAVRGFRRAMNTYAASKAALSSLSEGLRIDLLNTPIRITTIHPGFIRSELSASTKNTPFMVDTETGCRSILRAIEKEGANYYVPAWPWAVFARVMKILPLSLLARIS